MKRRNFIESVISRQYDDPAINIQHISEDDEPSEATGGLIPAIEGPSTSTATGAGGLSSRSDFRTYNKHHSI